MAKSEYSIHVIAFNGRYEKDTIIHTYQSTWNAASREGVKAGRKLFPPRTKLERLSLKITRINQRRSDAKKRK